MENNEWINLLCVQYGVSVDRAIDCFEKAVKFGMMAKRGDRYVWVESKANTKVLFAYFVGRLFGDGVIYEYKTTYHKDGRIKGHKPIMKWVKKAIMSKSVWMCFDCDASQQRWNKAGKSNAPRGAEIVEEILK